MMSAHQKSNVGKLPSLQKGASANFHPLTKKISANFQLSVSVKFQPKMSAKFSVRDFFRYPTFELSYKNFQLAIEYALLFAIIFFFPLYRHSM